VSTLGCFLSPTAPPLLFRLLFQGELTILDGSIRATGTWEKSKKAAKASAAAAAVQLLLSQVGGGGWGGCDRDAEECRGESCPDVACCCLLPPAASCCCCLL
jgi:hypothetical protein